MSRGLGTRQREILERLERMERNSVEKRGESGRWFSIESEAELDGNFWDVAYIAAARSEQSAIRRALRTLEARGLIEVKLMPRRSSGLPGLAKPAQLAARLPVSVVQDRSKDNTYSADERQAAA